MTNFTVARAAGDLVTLDADHLELSQDSNRVTFYDAANNPVASFMGYAAFYQTPPAPAAATAPPA